MTYLTKLRKTSSVCETSVPCWAPEVLECRTMLAADMLVGVFDDTAGLSVLRFDDQYQPVAGGVPTSPEVAAVQGVAVAPDGTFYVSTLFGGSVLHYANDGTLLGALGANDTTTAPLVSPASLAFGPNGHLYVADLLSASIFQFDVSSQTQQFLPAETLQLGYAPGGFAFEADGDLVVGDLFLQGLNRYDADDDALTVLVPQGAGFNPAAVVVRPDGNILIGDITLGSDPMAHHQVLLYDVVADNVTQFINLTTPVGTGSSAGYPPQPSALTLDPNGDLLVGLSPDHNLNGAIQRYDAATGAYLDTLVSNIGTPTSIVFLPVDQPATIPAGGRHLFYNDSKFDGATAGADPLDDNAIATDKAAFVGGTAAPTSAFSSYSRGINGIMVDIAGTHGAISAADFTFKVGANSNVLSWTDAPAPLSVSVREGAGVDGSDRVTIVWANGAIANTWLQVIVEGNDSLGDFNTNTNLAGSDVFFFGSRIGDTFLNSPTSVVTTSIADGLGVRGNSAFSQPVTNIYDFNKDGLVSISDELVTRANYGLLTRNLDWPPAIAAPASPSAAVATALAIKAVAAEPTATPALASLPAVPAAANSARGEALVSLLLEPIEGESLVVEGEDATDELPELSD